MIRQEANGREMAAEMVYQTYRRLLCLPKGGPRCKELQIKLGLLPDPDSVHPLGIVFNCLNCPVFLVALEDAKREILEKQEETGCLSK